MTLAEVLSDLFPDTGSIRRIMEDARIPAGHVALNEPAINIWSRVLDRVRGGPQMWDLVQTVLRDYPNHKPLREAWEQELAELRSTVAPFGGNDTAMSLLIDLVWDARAEIKENRRDVSELRHETRGRLNALELLTASLKSFYEGQAARIDSLEDRPQKYTTRVALVASILAGLLGGIIAGWGREIWERISPYLGG